MSNVNRILFVDDNQMDRMILSKALEEFGFDYIACKSVEEFLPKIKEYMPTICLVDLNIHQANDGTVLIAAIRNILGTQLPIIVISANDRSSDINNNLKIGANDFICKPIDKALLLSKLSNYLISEDVDLDLLPLFRSPKSIEDYIEINFEVELTAISQVGVEFRCDNYTFEIGTTIKVENKMLRTIFPESSYLFLKIISKDDHVYFTEFQDLEEQDILKLRKLIASKALGK